MIGTIYRIYIPKTGESYVGYTKQDIKYVFSKAKSKLRRGFHPCKPLQTAVRYHGIGNTAFEILGQTEDVDKLPAMQSEWMKKFVTFNTRIITKPRKARAGKPVRWNGVDYPSIAEASRATGLSVKQLRHRLEFGYEYDEEVQLDPFVPDKIPMEWEKVQYESTLAAKRVSGISYNLMARYRRLGITSKAQADAYHRHIAEIERRNNEQRHIKWMEKQALKKREELERFEENLKKMKEAR